ncbi:ComEC/Rec2 family competence protein [Paenibacillus sp. NEAU-GSW1]|uniref:ComEC/Rec2 family competence protein n=1 Tax=Paenibacillus sp. NEAU-GSW1 TaxID=2682486 RepID=UPI0012E12C62|nr:ComEC/Rec2 family competence protein [Paenibacillus sp. NEAU-GSW1]MUT66635.1 DUF4131 domain-containing protein [Paenibacillus sp. NEAU-GSW1]
MFNRRPIVWFAVCWVFGSAAAASLAPAALALAAGALTLAALALVLGKQAAPRLAVVCLLGCAAAAGERLWADARNVTALPALLAAAEAAGPDAAFMAEAEGVVSSAVEIDGDRVTFRVTAEAVRVEGEAAPRRLRERLLVHIRLAEQPEQAVAAAWQRGDRVRIAGELARPAGASNSGGFDYRRYLRSSQQIHWLLRASGTGAVDRAPGPPWSAAAMLGRVDAARGWLGARMDELYPSDQSGYMKGLVLGVREDLDPGQFQQFSRLGLTHILAISGLHVAVFLYALGGLFRLCRMTRERMLLALLLAVPFYVLLAGASPSVVRAGLMAMLGLLAARLGQLKDGLHLLAASAVLMLMWNPYLISDVSFQLSYIVTAGLIIGVPPLRKALPDWRKGKALLDLLAVTLVAQAAAFPVSICYFNQFHLLSLPANLALVPFISFIVMPLGAAALLFGMIWPLGGKLLAAAGAYANDATFWLVDKLADADGLRTIWASPPLWWIAAWYLLFIAGSRLLFSISVHPSAIALRPASDQEPSTETMPLYDWIEGEESPRRRTSIWKSSMLALIGLAAAALLVYAYYPDRFDRSGSVHVLDVGQGDSIYIRTPSGKRILIDGGGTLDFRKSGEEWRKRNDPFEVGRKVVVPLLMKRGVHELDLLVVSHLDSDHIRGLQAVLDSIPVRGILWNGTMKREEDAEALLSQATARGIPLYRAEAGQQWKMDGDSLLSVLWPQARDKAPVAAELTLPSEDDQNPISVVILMKIYKRQFLFAGDIDSAVENEIVKLRAVGSKDKAALDDVGVCCEPIDVLKAAHHGSRYSTSEQWLHYWQPLAAALSAGSSNTYGHPHPDVLTRLHDVGASIYRTDTDGEISYKVTAANDLIVRTVKP